MSSVYGVYQPGDSWLHRLDPRTKLMFVVCACLLMLLGRNVWLMFGALCLTQVVLWTAHIRWRSVAWVWRTSLPPMAMIAILWVVFYRGPGPVLWSWWLFEVGAHTLAEGLAVALRVGGLAFVVYAWLFSTDQTTLVRGLVALGLPFQWGLTLAMALRYLPTMANAFRTISEAQQARALDLSKGNPLQRARAYIPITVAMIITAIRTAENLSRALESRALGSRARRTHYRQLHFGRTDLLWCLASGAITGLLLWLRFSRGFGTSPY